MRDLSATLDSAIEAASTNHSIRATIYKSRSIFSYSDLNDSQEASFAHSRGIQSTPIPQDFHYSLEADNPVAAYIYEGKLWYHETSGSSAGSPAILLYSGSSIAADNYSRPGLFSDETNTYLFYYSAGELFRLEIQGTTVNSKDRLETGGSPIWSSGSLAGPCALHPIDDLSVIAIWAGTMGGWAASYISTSGSTIGGDFTVEDAPGEFLTPDVIIDPDEDADDYYLLHNSGAVIDSDDNIFIYVSMHDGNAMGIRRSDDAIWSERFEVVPSDLSQFVIANVVRCGSNIVLCGQFQRIDDKESFDSTYVYCLALWSPDGFTFSLDKDTLFAFGDTDSAANDDLMCRRFMLAYTQGTIYFNDCGMWVTDDSPYWADGTNADSLSIPENDIEKLSCNMSAMSMRLANSDEYYSGQALMAKGNRIVVDIGYSATSAPSRTWTEIMDGYIDAITINEMDGHRGFDLRIENATIFRAKGMTHPFYMEMESKQSIHDTVEDWSKLYDAPLSFEYPSWVNVDFFTQETGTVDVMQLAKGTEHEHICTEFTEPLPEIVELPINVKCYGWGRTGGSAPGAVSDSATLPPRVVPVLYIEDDDGEMRDVELVTYSSSHDHFESRKPAVPVSVDPGSYPVIYTGTASDDLAVGDRIKKVGLIFKNENTGSGTRNTTHCPERIEIPEVAFSVPVSGTDWEDHEKRVGALEWNSFLTDKEGWEWIEVTGSSRGTREGGRMHFSTRNSSGGTGYWKMPGNGILASTSGALEINWYRSTSGSMSGYTTLAIHFVSATSLGAIISSGTSGATSVSIPSSHNNEEIDYFMIKTQLAARRQKCFSVDSVAITGMNMTPSQRYWGKELVKWGVPKVLLSTTPYTTINCEVSAAFKSVGSDAWAGVVCLASDGSHYVAARMSSTTVQLIQFKAGVETVLATQALAQDDDYRRILLRHSDGVFYIYVSDAENEFNNPDWSDGGSGKEVIKYEWEKANGPLSDDRDINHVGAYMYINPDSVLLAGFDPNTNKGPIGIIKGGQNDLSDFSSSGDLWIKGNVYSYASKVTSPSYQNDEPIGPYPAGNTYEYQSSGSGYSVTDLLNTFIYRGVGIGLSWYGWRANWTGNDDIKGLLLASTGGNYIIRATDWRGYIYDDEGENMNDHCYMSVHFCYRASTGLGAGSKTYITYGFKRIDYPEENEEIIDWRTPAFDYAGDVELILLEFWAHSQHPDSTVEDMIDKILKLSGGESSFPGDTIKTSGTLSTSEFEVT